MRTATAYLSLLVAAALGSAAAGEIKDLPANKWTAVHDGPPGVVAIHAKLQWMPELNKAFMWPSLHYRSRQATFEQHATVHYYSSSGKWEAKVATYPDGLKTDVGNNFAVNYLWLPGLKRILLLHGGGNPRAKKYAHTWLLDPGSAKWEALLGKLAMTDKSTDFNPARGTEGTSVPIYCTLVYDAHNKEAVLIGGCGTWGRVGKNKKEKLAVGDWFFDEAGEVKRVRRVLAAEKGKVTEGRKWYPANSGTWTFPEATRKWGPIAQPMGEQLPGRILPGAVYDSAEKKIVMFGGENFQRPLGDTWIYDCEKRTWKEVKPKTSPPPRAAHAMAYVAGQKAVLLAGGYGPGWKVLKDTWVYRTAKNEWTRLAAELPVTSPHCSADYDPQSKAVLLSLIHISEPTRPY